MEPSEYSMACSRWGWSPKKTVGGFPSFSLVLEVKANLLQHLIFGVGINLLVGLKNIANWVRIFLISIDPMGIKIISVGLIEGTAKRFSFCQFVNRFFKRYFITIIRSRGGRLFITLLF